MKRTLSILLALVLCFGMGAYASGEPSGGASGSALPRELAEYAGRTSAYSATSAWDWRVMPLTGKGTSMCAAWA